MAKKKTLKKEKEIPMEWLKFLIEVDKDFVNKNKKKIK